MPIFVQKNRAILFIHIPKTAGSSVTKLAEEYGWRTIFHIGGISASKLAFCRVSPQHFHAELLRTVLDIPKFDAVFTVSRDPFSRFVSEYQWQLRQNMTTQSPKEWALRMFQEYERDPYIYDNHIRPQTEFIDGIDVKNVFKLEEDAIGKVEDLLATYSPTLKNTAQPVARKDARPFWKAWAPSKRGKILEKKADMTQKAEILHELASLEDRIRTFYARDHEAFGYSQKLMHAKRA